MKYLSIKLTKYVQDLHERNSDEQNKKKLNTWRDIPYSWADTLNLVKMSVLPKLIYRLNRIPIKIPGSYFVDITKMILKLIWRSKRPRIVNTILKKN